jgi:hypothetical protein
MSEGLGVRRDGIADYSNLLEFIFCSGKPALKNPGYLGVEPVAHRIADNSGVIQLGGLCRRGWSL